MTSTPSADHASNGPASRADSGGEGALPRQRGGTPAATPTRQAYRGIHVTAGIAALLAIGAALALPSEAAAHTVTGTVLLWQNGATGSPGEECTGHGAHADITPGAPVRVIDAVGKPLAEATLQPGRFDGTACTFTFLVPDVARAGSYRIAVGDPDRPASPFTYREMHAQSWSVRLSLGA